MKTSPEELTEIRDVLAAESAALDALRKAQNDYIAASGVAQYVGKRIAAKYGVEGEYRISADGEILQLSAPPSP